MLTLLLRVSLRFGAASLSLAFCSLLRRGADVWRNFIILLWAAADIIRLWRKFIVKINTYLLRRQGTHTLWCRLLTASLSTLALCRGILGNYCVIINCVFHIDHNLLAVCHYSIIQSKLQKICWKTSRNAILDCKRK
jgi:hypothetical protein